MTEATYTLCTTEIIQFVWGIQSITSRQKYSHRNNRTDILLFNSINNHVRQSIGLYDLMVSQLTSSCVHLTMSDCHVRSSHSITPSLNGKLVMAAVTHSRLNKMANIEQMTFPNPFYWKMLWFHSNIIAFPHRKLHSIALSNLKQMKSVKF